MNEDLESVALDEVDVQLDNNNQLYLDGHKVKTEVKLSTLIQVAIIFAAVGGGLGGLVSGVESYINIMGTCQVK